MDLKDFRGSRKRLDELRIKYIEQGRGTTSSFQKEFGLSNAYFQNTSMDSDEDKPLTQYLISKIGRAQPNLNLEWLKYGKGEPWVLEDPKTASDDSVDVHNGRPYYNIDFLDGLDLTFLDEKKCVNEYISIDPYNKDCFFWCNITGASMSPLITNGSRICLRTIPDGPDGIVYGEVYAIVTRNNMRILKRVVRADDEEKIRLVPENKDPKYGDYQDILKSEILHLFKVEAALVKL